MYIETVKNRNSPPAILLRESYREDGKVKKKTLANLSKLPKKIIETLRAELKNMSTKSADNTKHEDLFEITEAINIGHIKALYHMLSSTGLLRIISPSNTKKRKIIVALIISRMLGLRSKLSISNSLLDGSRLGGILKIVGLNKISTDDCYSAMDWLLDRQGDIQSKLSSKHLSEGSAILTDLSSSYCYGECSSLVEFGYSRDKKKGFPQVNYSLLCDETGTPVSVKVFPGNTSDPKAFPHMLDEAMSLSNLNEITIVGDRGMISGKAIDKYIRANKSIHWITALKHASIKVLHENKHIQLSLFDTNNIFELTDIKGYKNEKLVVCRNEELAYTTNKTRDKLILLTKDLLNDYQVSLKKLKGKAKEKLKSSDIPLNVGKIINKKKMAKYFILEFSDKSFKWKIDEDKLSIDKEITGIYVMRTDRLEMKMGDVVGKYKALCNVEKVFRSFKSPEISIRPIFHHSDNRIKSHIFICMLCGYLEKHLKESWADIIFKDTHPDKSNPLRHKRTKEAINKENSKVNKDDHPVMSYRDLLNNLAGVSMILCTYNKKVEIIRYTKLTQIQAKAFELIGLKGICTQ
jgi:transposase